MTSSPQGPRRLNSVDQSPGLVHQLSSSDEKIALFRSLFRGREDVYPRRFESRKTGKSGYAPACANEWVRGICEKPRIKCAECPHRRLLPVKSGEDRDEAVGQVFVEFDLHRLIGVSIRGMSSCAEPAANAMAARTSSSDNVGKSARISAVVAPSARLATTKTFGNRCGRNRHHSARGRLKEFDGVAGRIVQHDLRTARSGHDIAPKRQSCFSQTLHLARQILHDEMNAIPAPGGRPAPVRQGTACGTCRPA
jgi:hypothetical protein